MEQKTVFISYRRALSKHFARSVFLALTGQGFDVFLDVNTIDSGDFDRIILNQIGARAHFILLISDGSLARCANAGDWVLREIQEAVRLDRNIVPVIEEGAIIEKEMSYLPADLRAIVSKKNALPLPHFYFDDGMEKLRSRYLKRPEYINIMPLPVAEQVEAQRRMVNADQKLAATAPIISPYTAELVVDIRGSGGFTSINAALKAAPAGARITVKPGTYQESIILNKYVTIEGVGGNDRVIVESDSADCIFMDTDEAVVSGLGLRCVAGRRNLKFYAVDIPKGRLILRGCDITSNSLACVAIHNAAARPYIVDCTIRDGKVSGLKVFENGAGVIEECQMYGNTFAGIQISTGANPTIGRCTMRDGKQGGLLVNVNGMGVIEDCQIYGNAISGIEIREQANPTIRNCTVTKNLQRGVYAHTNGRGTVENCDLRGNTRGAWLIESGAEVVRRGNQE